jgi:hypothetical protein
MAPFGNEPQQARAHGVRRHAHALQAGALRRRLRREPVRRDEPCRRLAFLARPCRLLQRDRYPARGLRHRPALQPARLAGAGVEPDLACEPGRNVAADCDALARNGARMRLVAVRVCGEVAIAVAFLVSAQIPVPPAARATAPSTTATHAPNVSPVHFFGCASVCIPSPFVATPGPAGPGVVITWSMQRRASA